MGQWKPTFPGAWRRFGGKGVWTLARKPTGSTARPEHRSNDSMMRWRGRRMRRLGASPQGAGHRCCGENAAAPLQGRYTCRTPGSEVRGADTAPTVADAAVRNPVRGRAPPLNGSHGRTCGGGAVETRGAHAAERWRGKGHDGAGR